MGRQVIWPLAAALICISVVLGGQTIARERPIVVGYTEFPPYSFTSHSGEVTGFSAAILRSAADILRRPIEFRRLLNVAELTEQIEKGEVDVSVLLAITPARQELADFTQQVGVFQLDLIFLDQVPHNVRAGDFSGLRVGVAPGTAPDRLLGERQGVERVYLNSVPDRLFALLSGKVDALAGPTYVFRAAAKEAGFAARIAEESVTIAQFDRAFMVSRSNPGLAYDLDRALEAMRADGRLDAMEKAWLESIAPTFKDWLVYHSIVVVGVLGAALSSIAIWFLVFKVRQRAQIGEVRRTQAMADALDAAGAGILVFDRDGHVQLTNAALFEAFPTFDQLNTDSADVKAFIDHLTKNLLETSGGEDVDLASSMAKIVARHGPKSVEVLLRGSDSRTFTCFMSSLSDGRVVFVATDVSELEENRRAIEEQASELRVVNKKLGTFTRVAAHDLKSPAASTATLLDWIAEDLQDAGIEMPHSVADAISQARGLLQRQVSLIEDLLAFARASKATGVPQVIDPFSRLSSANSLIEWPHGFEFDVAPDLPKVIADPAAFDLVLRNLLSNAIKHHDQPTGRVYFAAKHIAGDLVEFSVFDDGPGISAKYTDRVFEPFFRLNADENNSGSGLGLALIKSTVEAWGGQVSISDVSPRGTCLSFTVPSAGTQSKSQPDGNELRSA